MAHESELETRTNITFNDTVNGALSITYKGLLNLQEGDIINVPQTCEKEKMPILPGNYLVRRGCIANQLTLNFDEKKPAPDHLIRYFECARVRLPY